MRCTWNGLLLIALSTGCSGGMVREAPMAGATLYRLEFRMPSTEQVWPEGGGPHAFLVAVENGTRVLAVTAHHALEVGGPRTLAEMRQYLRDVRLRSVESPDATVPLGDPLPVDGAERIGRNGWGRDVALLPVIDSGVGALRLGSVAPTVGDTIWLMAATQGMRERRHPARVAISNDSMLVYQYLSAIDTRLTSGAAVLNRAGAVVGVNVGTTSYDAARWDQLRAAHSGCCVGVTAGATVGIAVPASSILRRGRLRP